jgi:hypothetical protein
MSPRDRLPSEMAFKSDVVMAAVLYHFRIAQIVCLSITTFCVCYLVWMHRNHCHFWWCSSDQYQHTAVPIGEVMMITAVSVRLSVYPAGPQLCLPCGCSFMYTD